MKAAPVAGARAPLRRLLARVKRGEEILITERGKPVAKIVPLRRDSTTFPEHLLDLERAGLIRLGTGRRQRASGICRDQKTPRTSP